MKTQNKTIVLVGFMGVGKTTIGKKVAKALDLTFNDSDKLVEEKVGLTVKEIFDVHGEIYFRGLEEAMILSCLSEDQPQVLALGGGAFINDRIREVCIEKGDAIFLKISWEEWKKRADDLRPTRPLLQKNSEDEIHTLFEVRQQLYSQAPTTIVTDNLTIEEIVEAIQQR